MGEEVRFFLTKDDLDEFRKKTVNETINAIRKEEERLKKEKSPLVMTKKLLRSYRAKKVNIEEEEFDRDNFSDLELAYWRYEQMKDLMESTIDKKTVTEARLELESQKTTKDILDVRAVDDALRKYRKECESTGTEEALRRYHVVRFMHIEDAVWTVEDIANCFAISEKTVYHDLKCAYESLSEYLW